MADIHELARMLKELDDQLQGCMRCGMCQAVCPLFAQTGREPDVARGKIALLDGLASELISDPVGVKERLDRCLLCGTCEANCPSGVKVLDIFFKARAILTGYLGLSPAKKAIFRGLLSNPKLFNSLLGFGAKFQKLFTKEVNDMLGSSCARFQAPVVGDRHFKGLADKPFHKITPSLDTPAGKSKLRVAYFPGCVIDKVFPNVAVSVLKVMEHHGVGVYMPPNQACCGIPALSSGDATTFQKLVAHNLEVFGKGDYDYFVTACATCTATIKKLWPRMADRFNSRGQMRTISDKTMDVNQFLVDVLGVKPAPGAAGGKLVTYHDPCHLKNSFGITAQPRTVISGLPGYTFKEMADAGVCCGCGGSFNLQHYDVSARIGGRKADNAIASGAETVATACPACMLQITDMLSRKGARCRVRHTVELYAESIG